MLRVLNTPDTLLMQNTLSAWVGPAEVSWIREAVVDRAAQVLEVEPARRIEVGLKNLGRILRRFRALSCAHAQKTPVRISSRSGL